VLVVAAVLASLAALLHVFIWWLESFQWTGRARAVFGTSREEAEATRELAYNQGYYNLFLALITVAGVVALAT
jgi:putative membrane protein